MKIEMTGYEDRQGPWKVAVCGPPGSGKTMLSSTAEDPLFVFFQQEPRIKSVAERAIQHVKIVNDFTNGTYALDQMNMLLMHLQMEDHGFKTVVIDTGDEFFQAMKAGRTHQNGGEFSVGDWGWIADTYREVMLALIDLPLNVIVTFHTKITTDEGSSFRELMLQGQAKDEAPGWFDIVGALDTFETVNEHGETVTKRALLSSSSRTYPWVKDHSGALPHRFELSQHITDDFPRILELASALPEVSTSREVVAEIAPQVEGQVASGAAIPSPEELDAAKRSPEPQQQVNPAAPIDNASTNESPSIAATSEDINIGSLAETPVPSDQTGSQLPVEDAEEKQTTEAGVTPADEASQVVSEEEAVAAVTETLDAVEVFKCAECGAEVTDTDLRELTQIRFRQYLCRPHFKEKLGQS